MPFIEPWITTNPAVRCPRQPRQASRSPPAAARTNAGAACHPSTRRQRSPERTRTAARVLRGPDIVWPSLAAAPDRRGRPTTVSSGDVPAKKRGTQPRRFLFLHPAPRQR